MQIVQIQFTSVGKLVKDSGLKRNQCMYFYLSELIDELNPGLWWHRRLLTFQLAMTENFLRRPQEHFQRLLSKSNLYSPEAKLSSESQEQGVQLQNKSTPFPEGNTLK